MILQILLFLLLVAAASSATLITHPPGPYDTFYNTVQLTDTPRLDPFSPNPTNRTILTSTFIPTYSTASASVTPLTLSTCPRLSHLSFNYPLLIFSPGLSTTRLLYNILAQAIASEGYIVLSIDYPYDIEILEFPNGNIIPSLDLTDTQIPLGVQTRARDISFIIDQLSTPSGLSMLLGLPNCKVEWLRTERVGVYGHSLGDAAAAEAMRLDSRIVAGINLDGTMFAPVIETGLHNQSFLLFEHENKTQDTDSTWKEFWGNTRGGWKVELELKGAQYYTFSDLPVLLEVLGVDVEGLPGVEGSIGRLEGQRVVDIIRGIVGVFFGVGLGGDPEVRIIAL
ncbi:hypothetical protein BDW59DRAFT_157813 [Aspergillus cavernicola]|uniref:1-alkyl-2-acetylglycerophosphocholine esterase n=1 Tax=Aspergillus cavernicola TaxID=176166 RepID=A0ABR4IUD7_9EURO